MEKLSLDSDSPIRGDYKRDTDAHTLVRQSEGRPAPQIRWSRSSPQTEILRNAHSLGLYWGFGSLKLLPYSFTRAAKAGVMSVRAS